MPLKPMEEAGTDPLVSSEVRCAQRAPPRLSPLLASPSTREARPAVAPHHPAPAYLSTRRPLPRTPPFRARASQTYARALDTAERLSAANDALARKFAELSDALNAPGERQRPPPLASETIALITYHKQMRRGRVAAELRAMTQSAEMQRTMAEREAAPAGSRSAAFLRRLEEHQARVRARFQLKAQFYRWMEARTSELVTDVQRVSYLPNRRLRGPPSRGAPFEAIDGVFGTRARLYDGRPSTVSPVMYGIVSTRARDQSVVQPVFVPGVHVPAPAEWPQKSPRA
jgi:hypothetical protein